MPDLLLGCLDLWIHSLVQAILYDCNRFLLLVYEYSGKNVLEKVEKDQFKCYASKHNLKDN